MGTKRKIKVTLLGRIGIAMLVGIALGYVAPGWLARAAATFNTIFGAWLGFLIPLIIIGFVTPAIAAIGNKAGKLLVVTAALAYAATLLAGLASYYVGTLTFPSLIGGVNGVASIESSTPSPAPFFTIDIPPLTGVMTALVLSFMGGLGIAYCHAATVGEAAKELRDIVMKTIYGAVLPLLPFYIMAIFMNMTYTGQVGMILMAFFKIIVIIFVLHVLVLVVQYCIAGLVARRNPLKMLATMMPAYFTALGTQSSAATIPVTLARTVKMGVSENIAGFVVPLCATIHMSGSTLKIVACALALMIVHDMHYDAAMFMNFIAMLGVTIIAAPGIPGGAIMASLGLLTSILGFSEEQNALMIALYIAMDSFGTACNVTGDGALATIVDRIFKGKGGEAVTSPK